MIILFCLLKWRFKCLGSFSTALSQGLQQCPPFSPTAGNWWWKGTPVSSVFYYLPKSLLNLIFLESIHNENCLGALIMALTLSHNLTTNLRMAPQLPSARLDIVSVFQEVQGVSLQCLSVILGKVLTCCLDTRVKIICNREFCIQREKKALCNRFISSRNNDNKSIQNQECRNALKWRQSTLVQVVNIDRVPWICWV